VIHSIEKPVVEGATFTITRRGGKLLGRVIVPGKPKLTLVGGPGKESFVNGRNYPPTKKKPDREAGAWRIEFPFETTALVVMSAVGKDAPLEGPPVASTGRRPGFNIEAGKLRFNFRGDFTKSLPPLRVYENGKLVGSCQ